MSRISKILLFLAFSLFLSGMKISEPLWGFFGHKKINRMAVFTLPPEMLGFYKKNIDYITEHSIDPDKRRYNTDYEAIRHYIDLDVHGELPFDHLSRELSEAIAYNSQIFLVNERSDSTLILDTKKHNSAKANYMESAKCKIQKEQFLAWNKEVIRYDQREEYSYEFELGSLPEWLSVKSRSAKGKIVVVDKFSEYGIAPYYIESMFSKLKYAFSELDGKRILQLSSEIGHYVSDIHVPLHTTQNYNGADTDQLGIHAFWETRLPELYADSQYDFMVGKAEFVSDQREYIWDTVLESHRQLEDVFAIEKELSQSYPTDQQYCYEERNNRTVRLECEEYARAYHEKMNGMVEQRMRESIHGVGSIWFSAWVLAGQPDLSELIQDINYGEAERKLAKEAQYKPSEIKGRKHTN